MFHSKLDSRKTCHSNSSVQLILEHTVPEAEGLQLLRVVPDGRGVEHGHVLNRDALLDQRFASERESLEKLIQCLMAIKRKEIH